MTPTAVTVPGRGVRVEEAVTVAFMPFATCGRSALPTLASTWKVREITTTAAEVSPAGAPRSPPGARAC